jgi:hypothetical protein
MATSNTCQPYWLSLDCPPTLDLSVVVVLRNDNYGESQRKFRTFVEDHIRMLNLVAPMSEIVVVDFNSRPGGPDLAQVIASYSLPGPARVRLVRVPHDLIGTLRATVPTQMLTASATPQHTPEDAGGAAAARGVGPGDIRAGMWEFLAKNIGVRRARGRWVLTTNSGSYWTHQLARFLGKVATSATAANRTFFRAFRSPLRNASLAWLDEAVLPRLRQHDEARGWPSLTPVADWPTFGCKPERVPCFPKCRAGTRPRHDACLPPDYATAVGDVCRTGVTAGAEPVGTGVMGFAGGDFLLMHRDDWWRIGGHPETDSRSTLDEWVLCRAKHVHGMRQVVLLPPCVALYQKHHHSEVASSSWTPGVASVGAASLRGRGTPARGDLSAFEASSALTHAFARECSRRRCPRDWNYARWLKCGAGRCTCERHNSGLPSERLFDGQRLHTESFGLPEWELEERALN